LDKILVFCVDKILFGVNIDQIKALSKPGRIKKISGSPEWISGSVKYRNNTFPLVNFWKIMDLHKPQKKVLLLPSGFNYCGFLISGVKGIYKIDTDEKSSYMYSLPYLKGFGVFKDRIVIQMELDKLLTEKQKKMLKKVKNKNEKK
jgi:purine-binding chemotaxis protein CheW